MKINKIAIIGAGRLGSRHLEGVLKYKKKLLVQVVEPFQSSVDQAKKIIASMVYNHDLQFYTEIESLDSEIDVVIVASNSKERKEIVKKLLTQKKVRYLILEKVLFQKLDDYKDIEQIITQSETEIWVNHSRRQNNYYQEVKKSIGNRKISMGVWGNNWGLGCNGLHFLDLFTYFTSNTNLVLQTDKLDTVLHSAKREGYNEFSGTIVGRDDKNNFISITSHQNGNPSPACIVIYTEGKNYFFMENSPLAKAFETTKNSKGTIDREYNMDFQSTLTLSLIEDLNRRGTCDLTTFSEAKSTHELFLASLLHFMKEKLLIETDTCPIT
ncbi:MAG: Gfo/Idh/MocA family oxidoreductase [Sphingobacteriaceae bacterium]|nr:Gfo/Idh/MocA family oxidoreductase [Sphingobacteriaceae bacterium]